MTTDWTCPEPSVLEQLVLGQLTGTDTTSLEKHLAVCPYCAATLQSLPAEDDLVRALTPPLRPDETPHRHLAESAIPTLKRLRPRSATVSWNLDTADLPTAPHSPNSPAPEAFPF